MSEISVTRSSRPVEHKYIYVFQLNVSYIFFAVNTSWWNCHRWTQMPIAMNTPEKDGNKQNQNRLSKQWCPITTCALTLCDVYNQKHSHLSALHWETASTAATGASTLLRMQSLGLVGFETQISWSVNLFQSNLLFLAYDKGNPRWKYKTEKSSLCSKVCQSKVQYILPSKKFRQFVRPWNNMSFIPARDDPVKEASIKYNICR